MFSRKASVGAFLIGGTLLFGVGLFLIGSRQKVFMALVGEIRGGSLLALPGVEQGVSRARFGQVIAPRRAARAVTRSATRLPPRLPACTACGLFKGREGNTKRDCP